MLTPGNFARGLLDLLAPRRCSGCDVVLVGEEDGFCGGCDVLIDAAPPASLPPARSASLVVFAGPMADAIRRVKYERRSDLVAPLASLLAAAAPAYTGRIDAVMPVPLHRARLAERGFNQSALLAKPLVRALCVPLHVGRLVRVRATRPQVGLDARARRDNVRAAFAVRGRLAPRILLVDDVRTSGATLHEAARVIRETGSDVYTLTLALAPRDRTEGG